MAANALVTDETYGLAERVTGPFRLGWGRFGSFRERRFADPTFLNITEGVDEPGQDIPEIEPETLQALSTDFDASDLDDSVTPFRNFGATNGLDALALCATELPFGDSSDDAPPKLCFVITDGAINEIAPSKKAIEACHRYDIPLDHCRVKPGEEKFDRFPLTVSEASNECDSGESFPMCCDVIWISLPD
ncbi:MAG: hypothetical protein AAFW66_08195 [Pseudomonadota bacterium]